jgi:hypothetical protein
MLYFQCVAFVCLEILSWNFVVSLVCCFYVFWNYISEVYCISNLYGLHVFLNFVLDVYVYLMCGFCPPWNLSSKFVYL